MRDRELYRQLLGLREPWKVSEVKIDMEGQKIAVYIEWPPEKEALCPECGKSYLLYDHRGERRWRHLDTMQFETILHCRIPRIRCKDHGVKSIEIPWAEERARFTSLFDRHAIQVLLACQTRGRRRNY